MKVYVTLITTVLSIGLMIATASSQTQQAGQQKINHAEMVEDIEIMCRIIDKTMKENFMKEYQGSVFFGRQGCQGSGFFGRQGCQGFYLKNYGVVFNLEVQFPVADKEIKVIKKKKTGDLWSNIEREIRRQPHPEDTRLVTEKSKSYDTDKVNKLKEKLAYIIGEYGMRLGQLESDDMISIVIFGRSGRSSNAVVWNPSPNYSFTVTEDGLSMSFPNAQIRVVEKHIEDEKERIQDENKRIEDETERIKKEIKTKIRSEAEVIEENAEEAYVTGVMEFANSEVKVIGPKTRKVIVRNSFYGGLSPQLFPFNLQGKPTMTMILTFNRSMLKNKKGSDWEKILEDADIVQY